MCVCVLGHVVLTETTETATSAIAAQSVFGRVKEVEVSKPSTNVASCVVVVSVDVCVHPRNNQLNLWILFYCLTDCVYVCVYAFVCIFEKEVLCITITAVVATTAML